MADVSIDPMRLIRQSRAKWRIIAKREMAEFLRGERSVVGNFDARREVDLVRLAYALGKRDAGMAEGPGNG